MVIASLMRNEAEKGWLRSIVKSWQQITDNIIVLNDNSTDDTVELLEELGVEVRHRPSDSELAWVNEAPARKELAQLAVEFAEDRNEKFVTILDGDMTFRNDPSELLDKHGNKISAVAYNLYDIWRIDGTELHFRVDGHWKGHTNWRVWTMRREVLSEALEGWDISRDIHCGHLPWPRDEWAGIAAFPERFGLIHLAYATPDQRLAKAAAYESKRDSLSPVELDHARSIVSEPELNSLRLTSWPLNREFSQVAA